MNSKITEFIRVLLFCLFSGMMFGQVHPSVDPNYSEVQSKSDEFNSALLDNTKWREMIYPGDLAFGGNSRWTSSNVILDTGYLFLKVDAPNENGFDTTYLSISECCHTGGIISLDTSYHYGYYEARAKLPGHYKANGEPTHHKFHPAWWMFNSAGGACKFYHDEIDIIEPDPWEWRGWEYPSGKSNNYGVHGMDLDNMCDGDTTAPTVKYIDDGNVHSEPLFEDFHTYAIEWHKDKIVYYFDGVAESVTLNDSRFPNMVPMQMILGLQIKQFEYNGPGLLFDPSATFPNYFIFDYMRYYTLSLDCSTDASILNNLDLATFNYGVKNSIQISSPSSNITLINGQIYVFRAVESISIEGGFSMSSGTELHILPTPCN